jgi:hypothetical protein
VAIPVAAHGTSAIGMGLYNLANGQIVYSTSPDGQTPSSSSPSPKYKASLTDNYKEIKGNKAANDASKEYGYKDAHELKDTYVEGNGSKFNIYRDSKSGKLQLRDIKTQKIKIDVSPKN